MPALDLRQSDLLIIRTALARFPSVRQARIFGSRANNAAKRASDIDLAILAPGATAMEWSNIREALEEAPIIYELDIVRQDGEADPKLLNKIEQEGIVIYDSNLNTAKGAGF
jgi:predicted nucleotidyltransferase